MTTKQFSKFLRGFCKQMIKICDAKNSDYTGENESAFWNFELASKLNITSTDNGFLVRMLDKIGRLRAITSKDNKIKVKDEAVENTLVDLAVYAALYAGWLQTQRNEKHIKNRSN